MALILLKQALNIPILANGDIKNIEDARFIFSYTQVDGLMLGRISHGRPWIFKEINDILVNNSPITPISDEEKFETILSHIDAIHRYYGTEQGVRIARKHIGWYLSHLVGHETDLLKPLTRKIFPIKNASEQLESLRMTLSEC